MSNGKYWDVIWVEGAEPTTGFMIGFNRAYKEQFGKDLVPSKVIQSNFVFILAGVDRLKSPEKVFNVSVHPKSNESLSAIIPVWFCGKPEEDPVDKLNERGVSVPAPFLCASENLSGKKLFEHLLDLSRLYPQGLSMGQLRSIGVGVFRQLSFLDANPHERGMIDFGKICKSSTPLDTEIWKDNGALWPSRIKAKMKETESLLIGRLFEGEASTISEICTKLEKKIVAWETGKRNRKDTPNLLVRQLGYDLESAFPRQRGEFLGLEVPGGKLRVLLLDDDKDVLTTLQSNVPGLFEFEYYQPQGFHSFIKHFSDKNKTHPGYFNQFDLVLLDLSLQDGVGKEPEGYQYLPILRKFIPVAPIIVHSSYQDMGHIEKAYRYGASWYLPKSQSRKLGRHYSQLIRNPLWHREWSAVEGLVDFDCDPKTCNDEVKYMLWKALQHLPGSTFRVRRLTGGIGGALTVMVGRQVRQSYNRIAPSVVKIDTSFAMTMEQSRFRRWIAPYLGNQVGRIERALVRGGGTSGAIAYTYTGTSHDRNAKVVTLKEVVKQNLAGLDDRVFPFYDTYGELFSHIYDSLLPRIHRIDPRTETSECDYPNRVFDENELAVNSYLSRLPADELYDMGENFRSESETGNPSQVVTVLEPDPGKKIIKALKWVEKDKIWTRVDITGLGGVCAEFYSLRPHQPLHLPSSSEPQSIHQDIWVGKKGYWVTKDGKSLWDTNDAWFNLMGSGKVEHLADMIGELKAFCIKEGREVLQEGRVGIIHGDLNFGNIMVEKLRMKPLLAKNDPWLIDFARTRRDRIVYDFTQFEQDILYTFFDPAFFLNTVDPIQDTGLFLDGLIKAPWQLPLSADHSNKIRFIIEMMQLNREAAELAGVGEREYLFSLTLQLLIVHKIAANSWRKAVEKGERSDLLAFRAKMLLCYALKIGDALGFKPTSNLYDF